MADVLTPIMVCLGFSDADLTGRNQLRIDVGGTPSTHTLPLPGAGSYYFNNRAGASRPNSWLKTALDAAEVAAATGATWKVFSNTKGIGNTVLGYETFQRSVSGVQVTLEWTHASSTLLPEWFGFASGADTVLGSSDREIPTDHQPRRLWISNRFPARWESRGVKSRKSRLNKFTGDVIRFGHGGYRVWRLKLEKVDGLLVYKDRSSHSTYLGSREGVNSGDPHVSWEGGIWEDLADTGAPLRVYPNRDNLTEYVDVQVYRSEELEDLQDVWTERSGAPQRYDAEFFLVEVPS